MTKLFVTLLVLDLGLRFILYDVILVNICAIVETLRQLFERSIRFISSLYVNSNHYYQNSCQLTHLFTNDLDVQFKIPNKHYMI